MSVTFQIWTVFEMLQKCKTKCTVCVCVDVKPAAADTHLDVGLISMLASGSVGSTVVPFLPASVAAGVTPGCGLEAC